MNPLSVTEGVALTLTADAELQTSDQILWTFGEKKDPIAEIRRGAISTYEIFRGRLMLDKTTGSLTITNTRNTDAGSYKLQITQKRKTSFKRFCVTVFGESLTQICQCNIDFFFQCIIILPTYIFLPTT